MSVVAAASQAEAAPVRRFDVGPNTYSEALIELAIQGQVSLLGASSCRGHSRTSLRGAYTVEEALRRLLAGAPCRFVVVGGDTVRISAAAAPVVQTRLADAGTSAPLPQPTAPLLTEVTVTAAKRRQSLDDLPLPVTVLSNQELQVTAATDAGEASGQIAGLLTTNLGPGRDKIMLRGLSDGAFTGRARSTVTTVLDDAPLNYAAPDPDLRLADVERLEVIRGPQGTLYGAGALSGVYRIVTRKPDLQEPRAGVQASYATTKDGSPSSSLDGYVSIPIVQDRVGLRLVAYEERRGGFLDNVALRESDVDSTERRGARLALRIAATPNWTIDLAGVAQDLESRDSQYSTAASFWRETSVAETHSNHFGQLALTVRGSLPFADVTSSTSFVRHSYVSQHDATAAFGAVGTPIAIAVYREPLKLKMLTQDIFLSSQGGGAVRWLGGFYGVSSLEAMTPTLEMGWPGVPQFEAYREQRDERMREMALYGEVEWEVWRGWNLGLGIRVFDTHLKVRSDVDQLDPYDRHVHRRLDYSGASHRVSLHRDLGDGDLVYALYSEGHRPGGLNTSGFFQPLENWTEYESDRLHNLEVGGRLTTFGDRLTLQGAVFFERWNEVQTYQFLWPTGFYYADNVGDADLLGAELEAAYDFDWGLTLKGNALLTGSRVVDPNPLFALRVVDTLPGAPTFSGGVLAAYERPLRGKVAMRLLGDISYVGRSGLSFDAVLSPRMGDFLRTRLSAQLVGAHWTAELFVSNPTNSKSDTFAYGNPWSLGLVNQATPLRPRTLGVTLSAAY
ncbi:TonB-dependent receptor domain-containing protein [Phenylobacterium deserti]|uniref:TonB-dependent receptor domain-containing protein n=1 Tax=Phenylobacterium deserti TaxID=1914756 RepID=UPI0014026488|nr:TonB-dependent receptor [Phenylobacterium deserti]